MDDSVVDNRDVEIVADLSVKFPTTEVPLLIEIVRYIHEREYCFSSRCDRMWEVVESLPVGIEDLLRDD